MMGRKEYYIEVNGVQYRVEEFHADHTMNGIAFVFTQDMYGRYSRKVFFLRKNKPGAGRMKAAFKKYLSS